MAALADTLPSADSPPVGGASQTHEGRYRNAAVRPMLPMSLWQKARLWWTFLFDKPPGTVPDRSVPVHALSQADLLAAPDDSVFRLGHSTLLLKMHGKFWLTDPVFSQRASPFQWLGPARFHAPPIGIDALPPIEAVILSHDHYDHLDEAAVKALAAKTRHFIAPLGVGKRLVDWGIPARQVRELDWWQSVDIDGIQFVATPAQHFSGRWLNDGNSTLWASWVIIDPRFRLFFSGDSGYFDGFKAIGDRYGPFDMAFVETGAYDPRWTYVHMLPTQTLQAFQDLGGKWLLPIHNGTFDLAMHGWSDPFEQITQLAATHHVPISTPVMGERVGYLAPHAGSAWWRD
ncbi:MAG: MBL fold metallo-hydrolase [Rhodocyclaceae bacterium]